MGNNIYILFEKFYALSRTLRQKRQFQKPKMSNVMQVNFILQHDSWNLVTFGITLFTFSNFAHTCFIMAANFLIKLRNIRLWSRWKCDIFEHYSQILKMHLEYIYSIDRMFSINNFSIMHQIIIMNIFIIHYYELLFVLKEDCWETGKENLNWWC